VRRSHVAPPPQVVHRVLLIVGCLMD